RGHCWTFSCDAKGPRRARGPFQKRSGLAPALRRDRLLVEVELAALGLLHQRRRRLEAVAVALGALARAGDERLRAGAVDGVLVAVDVLEHAARPAGEADAEDRADVRVRDRLDDALVEALHRLDRLDEQHPLLEVLERDVEVVAAEGLLQPRPQPLALAVLVVVEARAGE